MNELGLLLPWSVGVVAALVVGACATEAQEPGVTGTGPATALTSDSGTESGTETDTETGTATTTSGPVTTTVNTAAVTTGGDDETVSTATTGPLPLGGTITVTSAATTGNAVTSGSTSDSTESSATNATTGTSGGPVTSGNNGFGGATSVAVNNDNNNTGPGPCTTTPATGPVLLEPSDGWVDCSTNDLGIQGEFFTYSDGNGSTITPGFTGDEICVEGTAAQIVGGDNTIWGAGLGVNLNQEEPEAPLDTWDADAMGISGFRFNLSAMPAGTGLRLVYQSAGTDYCVELTAAGMQTVRFSDTREACWGSGGDEPNPSTMEAVKWQVTTNSTSDHDFSFCISQLTAVP